MDQLQSEVEVWARNAILDRIRSGLVDEERAWISSLLRHLDPYSDSVHRTASLCKDLLRALLKEYQRSRGGSKGVRFIRLPTHVDCLSARTFTGVGGCAARSVGGAPFQRSAHHQGAGTRTAVLLGRVVDGSSLPRCVGGGRVAGQLYWCTAPPRPAGGGARGDGDVAHAIEMHLIGGSLSDDGVGAAPSCFHPKVLDAAVVVGCCWMFVPFGSSAVRDGVGFLEVSRWHALGRRARARTVFPGISTLLSTYRPVVEVGCIEMHTRRPGDGPVHAIGRVSAVTSVYRPGGGAECFFVQLASTRVAQRVVRTGHTHHRAPPPTPHRCGPTGGAHVWVIFAGRGALPWRSMMQPGPTILLTNLTRYVFQCGPLDGEHAIPMLRMQPTSRVFPLYDEGESIPSIRVDTWETQTQMKERRGIGKRKRDQHDDDGRVDGGGVDDDGRVFHPDDVPHLDHPMEMVHDMHGGTLSAKRCALSTGGTADDVSIHEDGREDAVGCGGPGDGGQHMGNYVGVVTGVERHGVLVLDDGIRCYLLYHPLSHPALRPVRVGATIHIVNAHVVPNRLQGDVPFSLLACGYTWIGVLRCAPLDSRYVPLSMVLGGPVFSALQRTHWTCAGPLLHMEASLAGQLPQDVLHRAVAYHAAKGAPSPHAMLHETLVHRTCRAATPPARSTHGQSQRAVRLGRCPTLQSLVQSARQVARARQAGGRVWCVCGDGARHAWMATLDGADGGRSLVGVAGVDSMGNVFVQDNTARIPLDVSVPMAMPPPRSPAMAIAHHPDHKIRVGVALLCCDSQSMPLVHVRKADLCVREPPPPLPASGACASHGGDPVDSSRDGAGGGATVVRVDGWERVELLVRGGVPRGTRAPPEDVRSMACIALGLRACHAPSDAVALVVHRVHASTEHTWTMVGRGLRPPHPVVRVAGAGPWASLVHPSHVVVVHRVSQSPPPHAAVHRHHQRAPPSACHRDASISMEYRCDGRGGTAYQVLIGRAQCIRPPIPLVCGPQVEWMVRSEAMEHITRAIHMDVCHRPLPLEDAIARVHMGAEDHWSGALMARVLEVCVEGGYYRCGSLDGGVDARVYHPGVAEALHHTSHPLAGDAVVFPGVRGHASAASGRVYFRVCDGRRAIKRMHPGKHPPGQHCRECGYAPPSAALDVAGEHCERCGMPRQGIPVTPPTRMEHMCLAHALSYTGGPRKAQVTCQTGNVVALHAFWRCPSCSTPISPHSWCVCAESPSTLQLHLGIRVHIYDGTALAEAYCTGAAALHILRASPGDVEALARVAMVHGPVYHTADSPARTHAHVRALLQACAPRPHPMHAVVCPAPPLVEDGGGTRGDAPAVVWMESCQELSFKSEAVKMIHAIDGR